MEGVGNIKDDVRRHFRTKLKNIFTKFIRKFGWVFFLPMLFVSIKLSFSWKLWLWVSSFELVKSMLPAEHHKVLTNIRKAEARNKRRKQVAEEQDASSESEEETSKGKSERYDNSSPHETHFRVYVYHIPCFRSSIEDILAESDGDLSEDEGKSRNTQKKSSKQKGKAWLKEGEGDDPLNFLDPKVSQRVLGTTALWGFLL